MKLIALLIGFSFAFATGFAKADTSVAVSGSGSSATSSSGSGSASDQGQSQGNSFDQKFDSHNTVQATDLGRTVPNVVAPALSTTLTETCMGSMSMGLSIVGMGMSGGATYTDEECVRRLDARQMHMLGEVALAREIMCDSPQVRAAAKRIGKPCISDRGLTPPPVVPAVATSSPVAVVRPPRELGAWELKKQRERQAMMSGRAVRIL